MRIDELLATRYFREVERCLGSGIKPTDVRNHDRGIYPPRSGELEGFDHVSGIASSCAHDMRRVVMDVIEVHLSRELFVCWASEEVQAAITTENRTRKRYDSRYWSVAEDVVVTLAACQVAQLSCWIISVGVFEIKLNAGLFLYLLWREELGGSIKPVLVDVGYDYHARGAVAVEGIGEGTQAHGACACDDGEVASLLDAHLMDIDAHMGVISGVKRANRAAHRLCE